jgi:hypothetical protein
MLTTDFNGKPIDVKKIVGGCLTKPLPGTCKGPDFGVKSQEIVGKPNDKKKSKTISKAAIQLVEIRKAQEDLNKMQKDLLGVNHQVFIGALSNDLEHIGTGVKFIKSDARGQQKSFKQGDPYNGLETRQMSR